MRLDTDDTHHNTVHGVHIANSGGVCFRGGSVLLENPMVGDTVDIPWSGLEVGCLHRGTPCRVAIDAESWVVRNRGTSPIDVVARGQTVRVEAGRSIRVERGAGHESVGDDGHR